MEDSLLIYDFDGTLTPYAWTRFEILEQCGLRGGSYNPDFIHHVAANADKYQIDFYASIWKSLLEVVQANGFRLTDQNLARGAERIEYNPGVADFLARAHRNHAKNYILSSGIKAFLDRTKIASSFEQILATTFSYNQHQEVNGLARLMNPQGKVEAIREILVESDLDPTDCRRVVYFGDGETDLPAMAYVKMHGGRTVFVHQPGQEEAADRLPDRSLASLIALADYSPGSQISRFLGQIAV